MRINGGCWSHETWEKISCFRENRQLEVSKKSVSSNLCRIFRLRWGPQNVWGSYFSRVERNFAIGQSPKIWGNFSKIGIKINKNLQNYWENSRKMQFFGENFFKFSGRE